MDRMKVIPNIGFEVLKKDNDVVVLKRVLPMKNGKRRRNVEMSLPKLSVHYFDTEELLRLQEIALQISERKSKLELKHSIPYKILTFFVLLPKTVGGILKKERKYD